MTGDDRDNKTVLRDDDEAEADGFGDNEPESFLRPVRAFCLVARKEDQITKKKGGRQKTGETAAAEQIACCTRCCHRHRAP